MRQDCPSDVLVQLSRLGVSRETIVRLGAYVAELTLWRAHINLVASGTLPTVWERHILDSAQLQIAAPDAIRWADLGSGGGLPGLVIACIVARRPGAVVHLIESNSKKAAFLRHVTKKLELPACVWNERIETAVPQLGDVDIVTARAVAPLNLLLGYCSILLKRGALGLFAKGREFEQELTLARKYWHFSYRLHRSLTDPNSQIIEINDLRPV